MKVYTDAAPHVLVCTSMAIHRRVKLRTRKQKLSKQAPLKQESSRCCQATFWLLVFGRWRRRKASGSLRSMSFSSSVRTVWASLREQKKHFPVSARWKLKVSVIQTSVAGRQQNKLSFPPSLLLLLHSLTYGWIDPNKLWIHLSSQTLNYCNISSIRWTCDVKWDTGD